MPFTQALFAKIKNRFTKGRGAGILYAIHARMGVAMTESSDRDDVMTLEEWLADERLRLETFARMWRENHEKQPKIYPMTLSPGTWDEMYRVETEILSMDDASPST